MKGERYSLCIRNKSKQMRKLCNYDIRWNYDISRSQVHKVFENRKSRYNGIMYGVTNKVVPLINPIALVSINNSQIRVDIKAANSDMGWMWFLTPTTDGITRNLKYAAVFMKLDMLNFFHQVELFQL